MSGTAHSLTRRAAELRRAFDRSFAETAADQARAYEDLLAITVGDVPYALRMAEIASLHVDRPVTPLPGSAPELLGLTGLRGAMLPVYDLRVILGRAQGPTRTPRWLVVDAQARAALAFDRFDAHLRVGRERLVPQRAHAASQYAQEVARMDDDVRPIVSVASVLDAIVTATKDTKTISHEEHEGHSAAQRQPKDAAL
ncbi:MAG: chemotaxis protein CheW [Acidobacteria bacterium]|nr:chemotaxis protein CheW [Acidobacteriota bacterium]